MSVSMQAFHTRLFSPTERTPYWGVLNRLSTTSRRALSQLTLFWISW
ncbi:MAG: hypothetical protein ACT4QE_13515 [Anaerolineales bacterium]